MTTFGPELTIFIDPSLTWKTTSKRRNTSRRSRRSALKSLKMVHDHGKERPDQVDGPLNSTSEKTNVTIHGERYGGNMEHIPIKKRRFLLRSPSPPPKFPNSSSGQRTCFDVSAESREAINSSTTTNSNKSVSDGKVDNIIVTLRNGVQCSGEDFSGTSILTAAACTGKFDNSAGEVGRSQMCDIQKPEQKESVSPVAPMKENIASLTLLGALGRDSAPVEEEGALAGLSNGGNKAIRLKNSEDEVGTSQVCESPIVVQSKSVASETIKIESIECSESTNLLPGEDCCMDLPNDSSTKVAGKSAENSGASRDYRFHWDLNTVMDEWDQPLDDVVVDSGSQLEKVGPANTMGGQTFENIVGSEAPERSETTGSGDRVTAQGVVCARGKSMELPNSSDFNSGTPASSKIEHNLEGSFGLVTGILKETCSPCNASSHAVETTNGLTDSEISPKLVKAKVDIDHSLSLGSNATKTVGSEETPTVAASRDSSIIAEERYPSSLQIVQPEKREIDFSLVPLVGDSSYETKNVDCKHIKGDKQAVNTFVSNQTEDKAMDAAASESDTLKDNVAEVIVPKLSDHCGNVETLSKPTHCPVNCLDALSQQNVLYGVHDSRNEESSQVTENTGNGVQLGGGYDSHLEDGELRESVGHCWEENEGEDGEAEHVDYDSDNREGAIFLEDANYSVQLSGEVLSVEFEKQTCSDNFSSSGDQPNHDKSLEENCSLRSQGTLPTVEAMEGECPEREFSTLKACSVDPNMVEMDHKGCSSPSKSAHRTAKALRDDAVHNVRDASTSGRELQPSDVGTDDSIKRSRSSNLDRVQHSNGLDDSLSRGRSSLQLDGFGERSWNGELRRNVANSAVEVGGEKMVRSSDDGLHTVGRSRIIPTSRSGYHFMSRGPPGGRDNDYGMGMVKMREMSLDNNSRGRFDKYSNGMNRGFKEGYRRPGMYEAAKPSGSMFNHFGKRERSFSPVGGRIDRHFPRNHRKSRSRSRTSSPDFRSEARLGRARIPYQPANSHATEHMRGRRSPVRFFNQGQRFVSSGSPGRSRMDDCIRPVMRPVRFHETSTSGRVHEYKESEDCRRKPFFQRSHRRSRSRSRSCSPDLRPETRMGGAAMRLTYQPGRMRSDNCLRPVRFPNGAQPAGRGREYNSNRDEYNNNNNRRKPRTIFERIHPIRHYDVDGDVRRSQYDEEDVIATQNFRRNENYMKAGERRPVEMLRNNRGERGNLRYSNPDRMFYSGPKQFGGMRDYAEDESLHRRGRP